MNILLLSTADWDHPFWTNKQHVALALIKEGHRVVYLDSLGLRPISINNKDRKRISKRFKNIFSSPRQVRKSLWVVSPLVIPGINSGFISKLNRTLISLTLWYVYLRLGFKCNVLWTYSPATTIYVSPSNFKKSIYHCVDNISAQPSMPSEQLNTLEKITASKVNHVFVTSIELKNRLKELNKSLHLMPNVVEYNHFANPSQASTIKANELMKGIPRPIIGFVGAISNYKVDSDLLIHSVDLHKEYSFVLIGSVGEGERSTNVSELKRRGNIFFLGPQPYQDIPAFMSKFDVGIIPCTRNEYTSSMFPMKFFEYLAAGIAVVAMEIPSLLPYKSVAILCSDKESFSQGIEKAIKSNTSPYYKSQRQNLAKENTYEKRTKHMLDILKG